MWQGVTTFFDETSQTLSRRGYQNIAQLFTVLGEGILRPGTAVETNKYQVWFTSWHKLSRNQKLISRKINLEQAWYAMVSAIYILMTM